MKLTLKTLEKMFYLFTQFYSRKILAPDFKKLLEERVKMFVGLSYRICAKQTI